MNRFLRTLAAGTLSAVLALYDFGYSDDNKLKPDQQASSIHTTASEKDKLKSFKKEHTSLEKPKEIRLESQLGDIHTYTIKYTNSISYRYQIFDYGSSSSVHFYKGSAEFPNNGPQALIFDKIRAKVLKDLGDYCTDNPRVSKLITSVNPPILWPKPPKSELDTLKESSISSIVPIWNNTNQKRYIITYENNKVYTYDAIYDSVFKKATISFYRENKGTDITDTNKMWITSGPHIKRDKPVIQQIISDMKDKGCIERFASPDTNLNQRIIDYIPKH